MISNTVNMTWQGPYLYNLMWQKLVLLKTNFKEKMSWQISYFSFKTFMATISNNHILNLIMIFSGYIEWFENCGFCRLRVVSIVSMYTHISIIFTVSPDLPRLCISIAKTWCRMVYITVSENWFCNDSACYLLQKWFIKDFNVNQFWIASNKLN